MACPIAGGSSALNFTVWSMPHAANVDMWERLGNNGWNWKFYHEYARRIEELVAQSPGLYCTFAQ